MIVSGDVMVQREGSKQVGLPTWNTSRAESLASEDRLRSLASTIDGTIIVQHDLRDVHELPPFPAAAQ